MPADDDRYHPVSRPYQHRYGRIVREHVFDKLRSIDMTLAEFLEILNDDETPPEVVAEARESDSELKELVLLITWQRPLHVTIVIDEARRQERVVTVYEPYPSEWTDDFRRRR